MITHAGIGRSFASVLFIMLFFYACAKGPQVSRIITDRPKSKLLILYLEGRENDLEAHFINGKKYYPLWMVQGFVQKGNASWYGSKFHGRATSSGEKYNMYAKTAAHKTWPLGIYVKVVNLLNGRHTVVRINDRGPFVKDRIIDLSYRAAKEIGLIKPGVAPVKIAVMGRKVGTWPSPLGNCPVVEVRDVGLGAFSVQVGAFRDRDKALNLADRLRPIFEYVEVTPTWHRRKGWLYRVRVSRSKSLKEAGQIEKRLKEMGFEHAFIVSL